VSAWQDLVDFDGSDEYLKIANAAMVELQAENPDRCADFSEDVDWATEILREGL
jgi:hypothetical protein